MGRELLLFRQLSDTGTCTLEVTLLSQSLILFTNAMQSVCQSAYSYSSRTLIWKPDLFNIVQHGVTDGCLSQFPLWCSVVGTVGCADHADEPAAGVCTPHWHTGESFARWLLVSCFQLSIHKISVKLPDTAYDGRGASAVVSVQWSLLMYFLLLELLRPVLILKRSCDLFGYYIKFCQLLH